MTSGGTSRKTRRHEALRWFQQQLGDRLLDAIVISTGASAYRDADGIAIRALALLGP
jgi:hypothetical protein